MRVGAFAGKICRVDCVLPYALDGPKTDRKEAQSKHVMRRYFEELLMKKEELHSV